MHCILQVVCIEYHLESEISGNSIQVLYRVLFLRKLRKYRKFASSNTSFLEANAGFFRLLMKGIRKYSRLYDNLKSHSFSKIVLTFHCFDKLLPQIFLETRTNFHTEGNNNWKQNNISLFRFRCKKLKSHDNGFLSYEPSRTAISLHHARLFCLSRLCNKKPWLEFNYLHTSHLF